jgi:hypothetical protein
MTAISWNSSTENALRAPSVLLSPFSWKVCRTIAVEDRDSSRPTARAERQLQTELPAQQREQGGAHPPAARRGPADGAHAPQHRRLQLQADQEQHHHHAELRVVLDRDALLGSHQAEDRADHDAGHQIAEHGTQAERPARGTATTAASR